MSRSTRESYLSEFADVVTFSQSILYKVFLGSAEMQWAAVFRITKRRFCSMMTSHVRELVRKARRRELASTTWEKSRCPDCGLCTYCPADFVRSLVANSDRTTGGSAPAWSLRGFWER